MSEESPTLRYSKDDWDEIRLSFATSLMVDTNLLSLSQNLEIDEWPIKGAGETPSKYIDFTWEELQELPGLADRNERIDLLVHILRETQAFDDPFGDMVATVDAHASVDRTLEKNINRLKIPQDFPMSLSGLSPDTISFCQNEDIRSLKDFGHFAQNMAQNIIIGGDFRALLNALTTEDQQTLAKYIPFRPGSLGLHLAECIGLLLNQLSDVEKCSLLKRFGYSNLSSAQESKARLSKEQVSQLEDILQTKMKEICSYFPDQYRQLAGDIKGGKTLERVFMVVDEPERECICSHITSRYLKENAVTDLPTPEVKRGGFFSRIFGRK
ncbi:hypothetical protein [Cerasicoccus arenae]|uniref:Uncharacterized protein n=1 Tax=Cerasicoccus arenae TaxID=424488 RepID=A0A8J3DDK8_9BACT|nr:hypothetical protein [Cerasicoccus arenae]MBK1858461.1 hypothetical protein [Cerasicoccus arenae]GHC10510.1 hypothetical protein GCM10007047_29850 [Cerasicoccus arenae]